MRIVFMGSGAFGEPTLRALAEAHDVPLVVTQPDRPAGRRRNETPTPIARAATALAIETIRPPKVNDAQVIDRIRDANPDVIVVVAFGQKVGDVLIAAPSLGRRATVNLHASLLPRYRGAAPINWAVIRGERVTGNTVFSLVDRMDAGDILGAESTPIDPMETAGELHDRLASMGPDLVLRVVGELERGEANPIPQDESEATLAPKLGRGDAALDMGESADEIRRRVHGLTPWPGVMVHCPCGALKLCRVQAGEGVGPPGTLIADGVVATGEGAIRLLEVQPPGKRVMRWDEYARGHRVEIGSVFRSSPSA